MLLRIAVFSSLDSGSSGLSLTIISNLAPSGSSGVCIRKLAGKVRAALSRSTTILISEPGAYKRMTAS